MQRNSSNSEVSSSELLENLEEIFPLYYTDSDVINTFKSSTTHGCVNRGDGYINGYINRTETHEIKI